MESLIILETVIPLKRSIRFAAVMIRRSIAIFFDILFSTQGMIHREQNKASIILTGD
jgi:hypothetical protein